ncbi:MAG: hypothetical protein IPO40_04820 [Fibrobacteres bacterium]|nr:hypothetical protein [Fibrobacterota bacterium]
MKTFLSAPFLLMAAGVAASLSGCASARPAGPAQVQPGWSGAFAGKTVGLYLVAARGPYTIAQFEAVSLAGPALERLEPGLRWVSVDSGNHKVKRLGGWDLDSLTDLLIADSAVWVGSQSSDSQVLRTREPRLSEATRTALKRIGAAMDVQMLIALRPGGARNAKDSLDAFEDPAWFGIYDLSSANQVYSLMVPVKGARSASRSAETDWAREVWVAFEKGILEVRRKAQ